jgi:DNA-binding transcriptional MocR family regulator
MAQTGSMNYQALFAQTVAVSPRLAAGRLWPYDFGAGNPAPDALPLQELAEATARALDREGRDLAQFLTAEGHLGLRHLVARKMALHEHVTVKPDQIIIGKGSLQLMAMLIDCFVDPGDTVLVEEFTEAYLDKARATEVNYHPGVAFSASGTSGRHSLRLAYCYPLRSTIAEGIKRLAGLFSL